MKETQLELIYAPQAGASEWIRLAINRGRSAIGLGEVSPELWRWRLAHPGGAHLGVVRGASGEVCSALIGLAHPARLAGEEVRFMELLDLYNDFAGGHGLRRCAALAELCRAFASEHGGRAPDGMPLIYGWPTRRAQRYLLSEEKAEVLRSEEFLAAGKQAMAAINRPLAADLELEEVERFPEELDAFFARFSSDHQALLVRDQKRLNWRFCLHPEQDYRVALVRRAGRLEGYAVQRQGQGKLGMLVDWAVAAKDTDVGDGLLAWAAELGLSQGHHSLVFGVSTNSSEYRRLQGLGFDVYDSSEYMLFRSFQKPFVMSWLFENWFYTFGDLERG